MKTQIEGGRHLNHQSPNQSRIEDRTAAIQRGMGKRKEDAE